MRFEDLSNFLMEAANHHHLAQLCLPDHHWADWYGPYIYARLSLDAEPDAAVAFANLAIEEPGVLP